MLDECSLSNIKVGENAIIKELYIDGLSRRRMMDLGIVPESVITVSRKGPLGDPRAYKIKGTEIAIRNEDADKILVKTA